MRKRMLSLLLAVVLCLSLLPTAALAEELADPANGEAKQENQSTEQATGEHTHYLCGGDSCNENGHEKEESKTTFKAWESEDALPSEAGNYYLTKDVTIGDRPWQPANGTVLCLNGHKITMDKDNCAILVPNGVTFTLTDCNGSGKSEGKVTHATGGTGCGVFIHGTFHLYGGQITGNTVASGDGGGVYMGSGTFNMYGGEISGNQAENNGGGVCVYSGTFNMYGGTISGNQAENGGVMIQDGGTFNMSGGSITENQATSGGGVHVSGGKFTMSGGEITKNQASGGGGGVYVTKKSGAFTMSGSASISGNTANGGGGVWVQDSTFTMTDGSITKNTSAQDCGGVWVLGSGSFTMSGGEISGNTANGGTAGAGGVSVIQNGSFTMSGGSITGNKATDSNATKDETTGKKEFTVFSGGGGVFVVGTFNMSGGSITNNTADFHGGGVYVGSDGKFTMSGGEISGNKTTESVGAWDQGGNRKGYANGGGVYVNSRGTFTVSGAAKVTGNKDNSDAANNVYLTANEKITIGGELKDGASIGVTTADPQADRVVATAASNYSITDTDKAKFFSDKDGYVVKREENQLLLAVHTHVWSGTNYNDSTMYVRCYANDRCDYQTNLATVKISVDQKVYDCATITEAPKATLTHSDNWPSVLPKFVASDIEYYRRTDGGNSYTNKITNTDDLKTPGKYMAALFFGVRIEAYFEVVDNRQDPNYTAPTAAPDLTYNKKSQVLIAPGSTEGGTMQYSLTSGSNYSPTLPTATDAGTYTVYYKVVGDATHKDTLEYYITVTIDKAPLTGEPTIEKVTEAGKTLNDVDFTKPVGWPDGTVQWEDEDGNELNGSTEVEVGKTYKWTFIPGSNYHTTGGTVVLYAKSAPVTPPSGGGSSSPSYPVTTPGKTENGTVTVSPKNAKKGTTVTVTVTPDKGYTLETLTVLDKDGKEVKLTDKGSGKYTFTMPAGKVEVNATFVKEVETSPFSDVSTTAYYYEAVKWAQEKGITGGIGNGLFGPNQPCTRAQAVTFLWRSAGSPAPKSASMPFTDVPKGSYYETAVLWAVENGITKGTSDTTFSPDATCSRAQIVTFLWRSQKSPAVGSVNPFTDISANAYYTDAVLWAVGENITKGSTATTFSPDDDCTRVQIVTFLYRACQGK